MMFDLDKLSQKDRENFKRVCNKLLSICFICRKNEATKADYYFILKYRDEISEYLDMLGYRLEINEEYGVIQLTNPQNYNRLQLKLFESIILLILRILMDEKKRELSLSNDIIVDIGEIQEKFMALNIRNKIIDKTTLNNALKLFKRMNLLEPLDRDLTKEDSRVLLYDSILMAVRVEDIRRAYQKIEIYRKGETNNEEAYEDQAD